MSSHAFVQQHFEQPLLLPPQPSCQSVVLCFVAHYALNPDCTLTHLSEAALAFVLSCLAPQRLMPHLLNSNQV